MIDLCKTSMVESRLCEALECLVNRSRAEVVKATRLDADGVATVSSIVTSPLHSAMLQTEVSDFDKI